MSWLLRHAYADTYVRPEIGYVPRATTLDEIEVQRLPSLDSAHRYDFRLPSVT